jgi:hypothetical protein
VKILHQPQCQTKFYSISYANQQESEDPKAPSKGTGDSRRKELSCRVHDNFFILVIVDTLSHHQHNSMKKLLIYDLNKVLLYRYPESAHYALRPHAQSFVEGLVAMYDIGV